MATSVRFPLPASVFPPMKVQSDQAMQFAATCERIVESTLLARREYVDRYQRRLDPASWELVKRRASETADLAVYKPRRGTAAAIPAASVNASPILIGTGSLEGSLDEVMLGLTATSTSAMRFVTSTMYKDVADARVLTRINTPNDSDPFAFLGFKWVVKVPSKRLVPLARARDFVFLESTGVRHLDDNETSGPRVGYQLMHSVDLSCCPALPIEFGVVRGYISFCLLFVECGNNRVDVFCKGFVDPRGGLSRRLTIRVAADVIMDCQHAVACAQRKKIEWTMKEVAQATQEQRHSGSSSGGAARDDVLDQNDCEAILCASYGQESGRRTMGTEDEDASPLLAADNCIYCRSGRRRRSTVTGWGQATMCGICSDRVCSRCSRQVTLPGAASATETTTCCMGCLERAETIDAAGFARELAQRAMAFQPQPYRFTQTGWASPGHKLRLAPIQKRPERRYTVALVD